MPYINNLNDFIAKMDFVYNTQTDIGKTITGRTVVTDFGNEYFEFTLTTVPMTRDNFYTNFMTLLQAPATTSTLELPVNKNISTISGTIKGYNDFVNPGVLATISQQVTTNGITKTVYLGSAAAGTTKLLVQGYHFPSEGGTTASGILKAGQLIKMGNKVHVITEDFDITNTIVYDSAGTAIGKVLSSAAILNVAPATTINMNAIEIYYDNFTIQCYPINEIVEAKTDNNNLFVFEQSFREVIG